uniref:Truncated thyroid hormone receptor beta 1 variant IVS4B n=1 Tax=Homo sapiens TaxID=9606 RepID=E0XAW8_HUMAN|nr:truncated thyroid hormone receptor beta 1 variant IVS4B [Homo sapiens]
MTPNSMTEMALQPGTNRSTVQTENTTGS